MTVNQKVTSLVIEDVQDILVELIDTFGKRGLLEQEAQFEIQDIIKDWFGENESESVISELATEITKAALECVNIEVTFNPNARLAKAVIDTQIKLGE